MCSSATICFVFMQLNISSLFLFLINIIMVAPDFVCYSRQHYAEVEGPASQLQSAVDVFIEFT
jgi:hypothetical protein